jgi:hypothetical protein
MEKISYMYYTRAFSRLLSSSHGHRIISPVFALHNQRSLHLSAVLQHALGMTASERGKNIVWIIIFSKPRLLCTNLIHTTSLTPLLEMMGGTLRSASVAVVLN